MSSAKFFFPQFSLEPRSNPKSQLKHCVFNDSSPHPASPESNTGPPSARESVNVYGGNAVPVGFWNMCGAKLLIPVQAQHISE